MEKYEHITGKQAIWQGEITKGFLKWKDGKEDYYTDKKRISVYIQSTTEKEWHAFIKKQKISSFSKLIRQSVDFYIKEKSIHSKKIFSNLGISSESQMTHILKEKLTTIRGFLQLLLEKFSDNLTDNVISIIENVLNESKQLEYKLLGELERQRSGDKPYDILLIEDDLTTIELLKNYFEGKGYSLKGVSTGSDGIEELRSNTPKLILLDIILPDISGFDICKDLKNRELIREIPVFYITAVPRNDVETKMEETKANGYILKPFDLFELKFLFDYL